MASKKKKSSKLTGRPPRWEVAMENVAIRFPAKLLKRLARHCKKLGVTRSDYIRDAVEKRLDAEE